MGWVYNLRTPDAPTEAPRLIAIALTLSAVASIAILLRLYVRISVAKQLGLDDYAALSSVVLGIGYSAIAVLQTRWGQALDPKYFPPENIVEFSKIQYSGGPTYCLALLGFKISLLASYLRFGGHNRTFRHVVWAVMTLVTMNQLTFTFVLSFACQPIAKQWDPTITGGKCINQVASYFALAGSSLGLDIIIIVLPLPLLLRLKLATRKKVVLVGIFAIGFFVTIIQIIRIFTIKNLKTYTDSESIVSWSIVEINLGVLVSCLPTYGPLFRYYRDRDKKGSSTGKTHSQRTRFGSRKLEDGASWDHKMDRLSNRPQAQTTMRSGWVPDNESEEAIITTPDNIITKTTQLTMETIDAPTVLSGNDFDANPH